MAKTYSDKTKAGSKAGTWQARYNQAASDQTQMFDKFNEWYKMMYAIRDDRNTAKWRSKIHIPILSTKAWNMIAKFSQQEPGFEVSVRDETNEELPLEELETIADKVQRKLEYDYHNPELTEPIRDKMNACLLDATVAGTGVAKVPWVTKLKKTYSHPINQETGEIDYTLDEVTEFKLGYNDLEPVDIFNVFVAPSAKSLQSSPWVIIADRKTLAQLKAVNEAYGVDVYTGLDALKDAKSASDRFAEQKKARQNLTADQDPYEADSSVNELEIFECYERDSNTICTYVAASNTTNGEGKWVLIREQKNPYWHGKFPLVSFYIRRRPFSFWGESLFETTERLQSAANDIFNHYMDNWNLSVDGGIMIEESSQVADFLVEPGFELVYRGEQPQQFKFPSPDPNQLTQVMNQIEKAVENATISNYATGTPVSGLDKTQGTARGTMAILEAATDMIQFMRDNFATAVKQIGEMWLSNNRQFMDEDFQLPSIKNNKFEQQILTPQELQLQMQLEINNMAMQPISDQQKRENFIAYTDRLTQLQTASMQQAQLTGDQSQMLFVDYHEQARQLAKQFNTRSLEKQIMPNDQALAVQNDQVAAEEQAAVAEEERAQLEQEMMDTEASDMNNDALEVSDLPGDEELEAAEEALRNLQQYEGR